MVLQKGYPLLAPIAYVHCNPQHNGLVLRHVSGALDGCQVRLESLLLQHLSERGILPQAHLEVTSFSEFDGNLHLRVEDAVEEIVLGPRITAQVFVEIDK